MALSDGSSVPLALYTESASPHEVSLVEATLTSSFLKEKPKRLVGDKAYDSDPLDEALLDEGIEMIAPHRERTERRERPRMDASSGATRGDGRSSVYLPGYRTSGGWWSDTSTRRRTSLAWRNSDAS